MFVPTGAFLEEVGARFFDDILVYSPTWAKHVEHLKMVLQLLEKHGWVANQKKCAFGKTQIQYLGH